MVNASKVESEKNELKQRLTQISEDRKESEIKLLISMFLSSVYFFIRLQIRLFVLFLFLLGDFESLASIKTLFESVLRKQSSKDFQLDETYCQIKSDYQNFFEADDDDYEFYVFSDKRHEFKNYTPSGCPIIGCNGLGNINQKYLSHKK